MNGITRTDAWREEFNAMGEAPVLEDGGQLLTQSAVILLHLANKHGAFTGRTPQEHQDVLRWLFFDNHKFTSYFATYRFMKAFAASAPDPAVMAWLRGRIEGAFGIVEKHLAGRDFIVGTGPTIADFSLSGYLFYPQAESGYPVAELHPNIASWLQRLRAIPGWASPYDVLPGQRIAQRW